MLGDQTVAKSQRVEALQFLIHLVGDLHMPLHAFAPLNHPAGAWVRIGETTDKLHLWWDNEFVDELGFDSGELSKNLAAQITENERREWEEEHLTTGQTNPSRLRTSLPPGMVCSIFVGHEVSEDKPIVLPTSVIDEVTPVVAQRLKMAGVRLAWLLNEAFWQKP